MPSWAWLMWPRCRPPLIASVQQCCSAGAPTGFVDWPRRSIRPNVQPWRRATATAWLRWNWLPTSSSNALPRSRHCFSVPANWASWSAAPSEPPTSSAVGSTDATKGSSRPCSISATLDTRCCAGTTRRRSPSSTPAVIATETDYRLSHLRYALAKLRAKGLVQRLGRTRRYRLTPSGAKLGVLFVKLRIRLLGPLATLATQSGPQRPPIRHTALDAAFHEVDTALDHICVALGLQRAA